MRSLVILRGAPGCGKSTFIKENNLENYTLCPDILRIMFSNPVLNINGDLEIQQGNRDVWPTLYKMLEARMQNGDFTVIDATASTTEELNRYKQLAKTYRYRLFIIDFTDIDIEVCKIRNKMRPVYKQVPDFVIDKFYTRFKTERIPSGYKVLKPSEFSEILIKPYDLSSYKKIHHIGDIHGCYTALKEYFDKNGGIKDDEYYIFLGDFVDRGIENAEVLNFLIKIKDLPNVQLIEGNHERHLRNWINNKPSRSDVFNSVTAKELDRAGVSKKDISQLCRKLTQCAYYTYHEKTVIATHGGISNIPENLIFLSSESMIKGVGKYEDYLKVADSFFNHTDKNTIQVNGHRNIEGLPIHVSNEYFTSNSYNLEGQVEMGGCLRCLQITKDNIVGFEVPNKVYKKPETIEGSILDQMRANNTVIKERKFKNISSFNFTRNVFNKGIWNEQTITARGLYLNNNTGDIVARAYNKFFNIGERPEVQLNVLKNTLKFPMTAYLKENGFLGIVGYDKETDKLLVTSKSDPTGPYAKYFKNILEKAIKDMDAFKDYIKKYNVSFVFECIDVINDPHIIEYDESKIVLLDIVYNDINFRKYSYSDMIDIANQFNLEYKKKAFILNDYEEFKSWCIETNSPDYKYNGEFVEGFVLEDAKGFMVKIKTYFYKYWKYVRGFVERINAGGKVNESSISDEVKDVYTWYMNNYSEYKDSSIIEIRKSYLETK